MLVLFYYNWVGTPEEHKEFFNRAKTICDGIEGVDLKGLFIPSSNWNFVGLLEGVSYEKILKIWKTYVKNYGSPPQMPLSKTEILHTLEELGM